MPITLKDYLTASGSYLEREKHEELTSELLKNSEKLLTRVNQLLTDLGITSVKVSSGFRPSDANAATAGAAKKSLHTQCLAIDLLDDKNQTIANKINSLENSAKDGFLKKYGLWLEHPESTKGKYTNWCHLDLSTSRSDRRVRVFKP